MHAYVRVLTFFAASLAAIAAGSADWPQYRGINGSGIAATPAPLKFGLKNNVAWSVALPKGHSSPSIAGDRIFLSSYDKASDKLEVIAVERKNGKIAWRQHVPATQIEQVHEVSSPATATPIVDGDRVYTYFGSTGLVCHNRDGKLLWNAPMPVAKATFGTGVSPALAGNTLIVPRDDAGERKLVAIDKLDGKEIWRTDLGGTSQGPAGSNSGHATPVVWKDQIVLHRNGELAAYSLKDGSRRWWLSLATQGSATPALDGDTVYVGAAGSESDLRDPVPDYAALLQKYDKNSDGVVDADEFPADLALLRRIDGESTPGAVVPYKKFLSFIDRNKNSKIEQSEWDAIVAMLGKPPAMPHGVVAVRLGGENDVTSTNVLWAEPRAVPEVPMPLVYKGRVYTISNGGIATAYDAKTGKILFRGRVGAGGLYYASPIAAGDRIYFASGEGKVSVIAAGDKLEVLAVNDLEEPIFATPAVVDRNLYVRTTGHLYAFNGE